MRNPSDEMSIRPLSIVGVVSTPNGGGQMVFFSIT